MGKDHWPFGLEASLRRAPRTPGPDNHAELLSNVGQRLRVAVWALGHGEYKFVDIMR